MKKSDIINSKRPSPLDRDVLKIWKAFLAEKQKITKLWLQDIPSGRIAARGFSDFQNVRMNVTKTGEVVISLKPLLGETSYYTLALYERFFLTYRAYSNLLEAGMFTAIMRRKAEAKGAERFKEKPLLPHPTKVVHTLIMVLKILVTAMADGTLTLNHLELLSRPSSLAAHDLDMIENINTLVRELGLTHLMSDKFARGGNFYEHPEPKLTEAYWRYGYRSYERQKLFSTSTQADG